jgi:hypothetical protein
MLGAPSDSCARGRFLPTRLDTGNTNRSVTAITEIVGCRPVGDCAEVWRNVCAITPKVVVDSH